MTSESGGPLRAVIYCRGDVAAVAVQERVCREWCADFSFEVVEVYEDHGTAGGPELWRMASRINAGRDVDFVILSNSLTIADVEVVRREIGGSGCRVSAAPEIMVGPAPRRHPTPDQMVAVEHRDGTAAADVPEEADDQEVDAGEVLAKLLRALADLGEVAGTILGDPEDRHGPDVAR